MPSNEIPRMLYPHKEIHEGNSFVVSVADASMADNDEMNVAFKTPTTTKYINMTVEWATKAGGEIFIIEAPTWTNQSGSSLAITNRNRNSSKTSGIKHDLTDTVFATGSKISNDVTTILTTNAMTVDQDYMFGSQNKGAAAKRGSAELILKANTQYVIKLIASAGSNAGFLKLSWYEHTAAII